MVKIAVLSHRRSFPISKENLLAVTDKYEAKVAKPCRDTIFLS